MPVSFLPPDQPKTERERVLLRDFRFVGHTATPEESTLLTRATDKTRTLLERQGFYEVIPRGRVKATSQSLQTLAEIAGADLVMVGDIDSINWIADRQHHGFLQAGVTVMLRTLRCDEMINGGGGTGFSIPIPAKATREERVRTLQTALNKAIEVAWAMGMQYLSPTATVAPALNRRNSILLNMDRPNVVQPGFEFIVFRQHRKIAKVRVIRVQGAMATALILHTYEKINPGDRAQSVCFLGGRSTY